MSQSTTDIQNLLQTQVEAYKLDHLVAVAESGDVTTNSIIAKLTAKTGVWSDFLFTAENMYIIGNYVASVNNLIKSGGSGDLAAVKTKLDGMAAGGDAPTLGD